MMEGEEVEQRPSSRRSLTARSNAARQMAVNFLPSRQLPHNTLRLRRNNSEHNALLDEVGDTEESDSTSRHADIIVRELEQHQSLMEDNPLSEELRREALRDLPQGLTMKRDVRAKLSASVSVRSERRRQRPISLYKRIKYRVTFAWKRSRERLRDAMFSVEVWYEAIHDIEGQYGSAVGSYFRMVRRLLALDLAIAALLLGFLVVPQALHDAHAHAHAHVSRPTPTPTPTHQPQTSWALDWITGKGGVEDSLLFYGHYHYGLVTPTAAYDMAFAYFFTMLAVFLAFFALLCYRTAYSYRRNFIETCDAVGHAFAHRLFCGWDFSVSAPRAAALHSRAIYSDLKELLSEQNKDRASLSTCVKLGQCLTNTAVTAAVLACIGGLLYGVWLLLAWDHWELRLSLLLTAIVSVCPALLHAVVRLEFYTPRTAVYVTLARTWLLDMGILMLLFVYWSRSNAECWETRFGQEAYRLVLLDALVSLFVLPAVEIIRGFFYKWHPCGEAPEFNIAYNSLTVIYNQAVVWAGALFSPLLAGVVAIKFLLLFYVKRACLLRACQPARKVWRAAQTQTVLYMLVTLSLFATLFAIGSLFLSMSSPHCGPFRAYAHVYALVSEGVLGASRRPALRALYAALTRPAVLAFMLLLLGVCVYYLRGRARAHAAMADILRRMLTLQAKDKEFLLTAIANVSTGEWLYSPKGEGGGEGGGGGEGEGEGEGGGADSHTWRYLREVRKPSNSSFHFDASRHRISRSYTERPHPPVGGDTVPAPLHTDGDTDTSFSWQGSGDSDAFHSTLHRV